MFSFFCRTDLPWWLVLVSWLAAIGYAAWHLRLRKDFNAFLRWHWVESMMRIVAAWILLAMPQISHTMLSSPSFCRADDSNAKYILVFRLIFAWAVVSAAIAAPLLVPSGTRLTRDEHGLPDAASRRTIAIRTIAIIAAGRAFSILCWALAPMTSAINTRDIALLEIAEGICVLILFGRVVDALLQSNAQRVLTLMLALPTTFFLVGGVFGHDEIPAKETVAKDWYEAAAARLAAIPDDGPVILVSASGGGSRAAVFATLVLETLALPPEHLDLDDGSGHRITPTWKRPLTDYVFALSSVSGGSVATAEHIALHYGRSAATPDDPATDARWRAILAADPADGPEANPHAALATTLIGNGGVRAMMTDFNAPAVRGLVSPFQSRGRALSAFWEERFGWTEAFTAASRSGSPPLVFFNAAIAESGRRLIAGFPPLPQPIIVAGVGADTTGAGTAVLERITAVSLDKLVGPAQIEVGDAVRMSASFPWGMDAARVRAFGSIYHVSDGGIVDNTGTATLRDIVTGLEALSVDDPRAAPIWKELSRRGVLVIEIDSGAKPLPSTGAFARLAMPLMQSASALSEAGYTQERMAVYLRRRMMAEGSSHARWATFSYCPRADQDDVMTAWALGPDDGRSLLHQYLSRTLNGTCTARRV